jgi:type 1 glutamine amidotransferase
MGTFHPIAWYHNFDGGRSFYTNLGHMATDFSDPAYLNHIAAGIIWAGTGKK